MILSMKDGDGQLDNYIAEFEMLLCMSRFLRTVARSEHRGRLVLVQVLDRDGSSDMRRGR
jgi:hypothetical protein